MKKIDINPAECYGCEYLDGDDWRCTAGEDQCPAVLPFAELYEDGEQK